MQLGSYTFFRRESITLVLWELNIWMHTLPREELKRDEINAESNRSVFWTHQLVVATGCNTWCVVCRLLPPLFAFTPFCSSALLQLSPLASCDPDFPWALFRQRTCIIQVRTQMNWWWSDIVEKSRDSGENNKGDSAATSLAYTCTFIHSLLIGTDPDGPSPPYWSPISRPCQVLRPPVCRRGRERCCHWISSVPCWIKFTEMSRRLTLHHITSWHHRSTR